MRSRESSARRTSPSCSSRPEASDGTRAVSEPSAQPLEVFRDAVAVSLPLPRGPSVLQNYSPIESVSRGNATRERLGRWPLGRLPRLPVAVSGIGDVITS